MPELPEVETIRRTLLPLLKGVRVDNVTVYDKRLRRPVRIRSLRYWIVGRKILDIMRRAKYLIFHFDNHASMIVHLGMSGRLQTTETEKSHEPHTHVVFGLSNGLELRYRDTRRFGIIEVVKPGQLRKYQPFQNLGVEPLTDAFSPGYLYKFTCKSQRSIKTMLMDATIVVGIGNIYANEALFIAGVHPLSLVRQLGSDKVELIVTAVKKVLQEAVAKRGTTINDFRNSTGEPGFFQMQLKVYDRKGEPCVKCGAAIERVLHVGRSTYYCPACQTKFVEMPGTR